MAVCEKLFRGVRRPFVKGLAHVLTVLYHINPGADSVFGPSLVLLRALCTANFHTERDTAVSFAELEKDVSGPILRLPCACLHPVSAMVLLVC